MLLAQVHVRVVSCFLLACFTGFVALHSKEWAPPSGYYESVTATRGGDLRAQLNATIRTGHIVRSYNDVTLAVRVLDVDPDNPDNILLIYSGFSVGAFSNWTGWNREHVWPRSGGVGQSGPAFSDFHHLYPCNPGVNAFRSNHSYDWLPDGNPVNNAAESKRTSNWFEPLDYDKGRTARAMLYMDVRYDGQDAGTPNLQLQEFHQPPGNIMGKLSTLLQWNRMFPSDERERRRNHIVFAGFQSGQRFIFQGNRNPFIDFPELADAVFLADNQTSWNTWKVVHFSLQDWSNPEVSGPLANTVTENVPNLIAFSQYLAPVEALPENLPHVTRRSSGTVSDFHFDRLRTRELSDVSYTLEYSETPLTQSSWEVFDFNVLDTFIRSRPHTERLRVSDARLGAPERTRHFRLRIEMGYPVSDPVEAVYDPVALWNVSGSIFAYSPSNGDGVRGSDWFGTVDDRQYPEIQQEDLGLLWVYAQDEEIVWLYDPQLGWLKTGRTWFPVMYSADHDSWYVFMTTTTSGERWFYNSNTETFTSSNLKTRN